MPIRWSALKVSEAATMIEELINKAAEPLEQIRIVAREARKIPYLPQYVDADFFRIIDEIDRAIGGGQFHNSGRLRAGVESVREDIPAGAIEAEQGQSKYGTKQSLI